jgi:hypothetical protein
MEDWVPLLAVVLGSFIATVPNPLSRLAASGIAAIGATANFPARCLIELQGVIEELVIPSVPTMQRDDYTRARLRVHTLIARIDDDEMRSWSGEMLERSAKAASVGKWGPERLHWRGFSAQCSYSSWGSYSAAEDSDPSSEALSPSCTQGALSLPESSANASIPSSIQVRRSRKSCSHVGPGSDDQTT